MMIASFAKQVKLIAVGLCLCLAPLSAQYDASLSQYFMAKGYYNPAYAGTSGELNLLGLSRLQWIGIDGAPQSFFVAADMPYTIGKTSLGLGAVVFTETIGLFNNLHASAQINYKRKLLGGTISGGMQIGIANQSFDGTLVETPDEELDPAIPTSQVSGMGLDINAGIYYHNKRLFLGIATMHLNSPQLNLDENIYTYIASTYNFMAGYNIPINNSLFVLKPSAFLLTDLKSFHTSVTARMEYNNMFNGGVSYSHGQSVGILLGASFGKVQVGYVFDVPSTSLIRATTGSHELLVRYQLKLKKNKNVKGRHKSVRIL